MSPAARRIAIPVLVAGLALTVVIVMIVAKPAPPPPAASPGPPDAATAAATDPPSDSPNDTPTDSPNDTPSDPPDAAADDETPPTETTAPGSGDQVGLEDLIAIGPDTGVIGHDEPAGMLGSLDPSAADARVEFSRAGAGIDRIVFSDIWETVGAKLQAQAHRKDVAGGVTPSRPMPDDELRYVLQESRLLSNPLRGAGYTVPSLAAFVLEVNGQRINLFDYNLGDGGEPVYIWAETAPGAFETIVVNADGDPVLGITRRFILGEDFDLTVEQRLRNFSGAPLTVRWMQYGPSGLRLDRSRYMDRRRYRFGFLSASRDPNLDVVYADDNDLLIERQDILKRWEKSEEARVEGDLAAQSQLLSLWPNKTSLKNQYGLSWFGSTNRYFTITVHPPLEAAKQGQRSLESVVDKILLEISYPDPTSVERDSQVVFTYLQSPSHRIEPGAELDLDFGVYAGPLDRHVLDSADRPYRKLSMDKLILYQMSSWCLAICTFQWLAYLLIDFLTVLHNWVVFDWGLAIIFLVFVVRALLHPITKRSQISMQRFGKQMQAMKPELDKLQKKFGSDPKKMQQEQMRLMREHGANPLQMLGCLPMFLQTPIWIALYAMLYFAFDLRQEAAFFGLFQKLTAGAWPFLADLSSADHFFGQLDEPKQFLLWNVTGFNVLPILMGVIFFIQQKYMAPPPSPTMSEDQIRSQKIMKVMMVVMFPLMLYSAPSGLTLYILTSSCIGILESRYVRRHITEMDLNPPAPKKKPTRGKPKDAQGRAFAAALQRMEEKKKQKKRGPEKRYKKRK